MNTRDLKSLLLAGMIGAALGFCSGAASAGPLVTLDNTTGLTLGNGPFTLGWQFHANSNITVTALGAFDDSQDGLVESHVVGLWDSAGNLLASTTVAAGTVDPLTNQWRYSSLLSSITLTAGNDYTIGAVWNNGTDGLIFPGAAINFATDPSIAFLENRYVAGGVLADPTNTAGTDPAYFGPNLLAGAVPEPSTWAMMLIGLAGLGFAAYRRRSNVAATFA